MTKKKGYIPAEFDLSFLDSVIASTEKAVKRAEREDRHSKEEKRLLKELELVELYIKNTTKAKRRRAMKNRDQILKKLHRLGK
jgi:ribosome-binding ATPase YchF (GTP1/OBG family)